MPETDTPQNVEQSSENGAVDVERIKRRLKREEKVYGDPTATMVSDLWDLIGYAEHLLDANQMQATRHLDVLDHFCRVNPDLVLERLREHRPISWDGFRPLDCEACGQPWPCQTEGERAANPLRTTCSSVSGDLLCGRPEGHGGVHRSDEESVSWGTRAQLEESLTPPLTGKEASK